MGADGELLLGEPLQQVAIHVVRAVGTNQARRGQEDQQCKGELHFVGTVGWVRLPPRQLRRGFCFLWGVTPPKKSASGYEGITIF